MPARFPGLVAESSAPKLVRDLAVLTGGQLVSRLIGLAAFAILARTLDPENYGAVEYMVGVAVLSAMAIDCGLSTIGVRRAAAAPDTLPALAVQIPLARLTIALAAIPMMIAGVTALGIPGIPNGLVWLYALSLILVACNQEWLLQSAELMSHVAVAQMLRMLTFAILVVLLVFEPADLMAVGWAELASVVMASIYYLSIQHFKVAPISFARSGVSRLGLLREGVTVGLSQFVWATTQYLPLFLLGSLVAGGDLAWFGAAQRLVMSITAFSFIYHFNLYPALARTFATSSTAFAELLRMSFRVTAWASVGLALGLTLAVTPILTIIFGARFAAAAPTLAILVWVVPVTLLSGHARAALIIAGTQSHVLYAQIAGLLTVATVGIPLVATLGDDGAAIAAVTGSSAAWIVFHTFASRQLAPPPPFSLLIKPLVLALVSGYASQYTGMGLEASAITGLLLYVIAAPFVDRALVPDLIRWAHAKSYISK